MIEKLEIEAFKCFEKESLEFRNLTILTGTNASGKSSVIQAILQLSLYVNSDFSSPLLKYLNFLSDFDEVINFNMHSDKYKISLNGFGKNISLVFSKDIDAAGFYDNFDEISYSKGNLVFLSADRIGPQDTYEKNTNPLDKFGIYGEYTIGFLEKARREKYKVIDQLCKTERKILDSEVNFWLKNILDTEIDTQEIEGTNQVKARFKNGNEAVRPKNIGSGISYLASIIIICLSAKIGQVIIIENPEIHLHPKAQAKLGEFLAFVASKGVQIIIETHNDHLINRFRYEVFNGKLNANDVIIHYKEKEQPFETINITEKGLFNNKNGENSFPQGFYDATLNEIYQINRGR